MTRYLVSVFLLLLCFIMPVQIYVIGDGIGAGVQGAFFRYQESSYGTNLITINQEVQYVISGIYDGRTALSVFVWVMGDIMLVIATILALTLDRESDKRRFATICVSLILSGIYFLISAQLQYGLLLHGAAGAGIPFGIILMIWAGWYFYTKKDILFVNISTFMLKI
jgi:hypothetical protein